MISLPEPEIIFTHESDLDGFVAGGLLQRLAKVLFGKHIDVEPLSSSPWNNLKRYPGRAWVCDLSAEPQVDRPGWVIMDHHVTEHELENATLIHDSSICAAKICYNLLEEAGGGNPTLARLADLTNVTDLYQSDHADFDRACDYARLVKTYHFRPLARLIGTDLESLLDHPLIEIMQLRRKVEDPIGLAWSQKHIQPISDTVAYVATAVGDTNSIVHHLLEAPGQPYHTLFTLFKKPSGPVTVSIRSRDGEALELAKMLQGGGHPNAAGATLPRSISTFDGGVAYLKQVLNPPPVVTHATTAEGTESLFDSAGF